MTSPFRLTVYDKAFTRIGYVGDPESVEATPRHLALGILTVTIRAGHRRIPDLITDGARIVAEYGGQHLISGPVRSWTSDMSSRTFTFTVEDDIRLLWRILGFPVPGSAVSAQSGSEYHTVTGPAETVVKTVVAANATRLGLPVTVATNLARGTSIEAKFRMHPLADRLLPLLDGSGIGVTVQQSGAGLVVDCYATATYPRTLTEASGVVQNWTVNVAGPQATRAVMGGGGEATAREFRAYTDASMESAWGDKVEIFVDARDTNVDGELDVRGAVAVHEKRPQRGITATLAETDHFRYGAAVRVGDVVTLEVAGGITVTDVLRAATLTWSADEGLNVTPVAGDPSTGDPIATTAKAISALARKQRDQEARS